MRRALLACPALAVIAAAACLVGLAVGTDGFAPGRLLRAFGAGADPLAVDIVFGLRMPRVFAAFATGGLLAVAGALMQALLRNPLADPYVLGVSGGAAVGALAAMIAGWSAAAATSVAALGASGSAAVVFLLARRELFREPGHGGGEAATRLLLTGVALAAGWSALVTLMLALAPEARLRGMLFWLMGDLSGADSYGYALAGLAGMVAAALPFARDLTVVTRGEDTARALGVEVGRLRVGAFVLASAGTALAVTTAGTIGFVGLIVPHLLRLVLGNDQRVLLPACAFGGGALLVVADTLARSVVAPLQLPVGVLMALIGVPSFLYLLLRAGRPS